jgi:hypothetical protein
MSELKARANNPTRRGFLKATLAAGAAPWFVPAHVLGSAGQPGPAGKIAVGVIGVGAQGQYDMRNFLSQPDVRVTAICDVNQRNIAAARDHIRNACGVRM